MATREPGEPVRRGDEAYNTGYGWWWVIIAIIIALIIWAIWGSGWWNQPAQQAAPAARQMAPAEQPLARQPAEAPARR